MVRLQRVRVARDWQKCILLTRRRRTASPSFMSVHLVWHRAELRTHDQPALATAAALAKSYNGQVVPVVIFDPKIFARPDLTPRRQAHFLENTRALRESYRKLGSDLIVREGVPADELAKLARELKATHLHFGRNYSPYAKERDLAASRAMQELGVAVLEYDAQYTHPPGTVVSQTGNRYGVFGPFGRKWLSMTMPELAPQPEQLPPLDANIARGEIRHVESEVPLPTPGEDAAIKQLEDFLRDGESVYEAARNFPSKQPGTSRLSYYFNIGVLSPRLAAHRARDSKWRSELAWWDFNAEVLDKQPEGATQEYREVWRGFPWRSDDAEIEKWKQGETGIPFVDAGMRQLKQTGFMHNRLRLVTASFLTKHLMTDWRVGEQIFRSWLLCGDSAQNIGNWQWVAGCGYDAAPFFRVFNPVTQGEKFDPDGDFVRQWLPELAHLPNNMIHTPWRASEKVANYPAPMIDLRVGSERYKTTAREFLAKRRAETGDKETSDVEDAEEAEA